jgi:hypothetical protein
MRILFSSRTSPSEYFQLSIVSTENNAQPIRLPHQPPDRHNIDPTWAPDGETIVFISEMMPRIP